MAFKIASSISIDSSGNVWVGLHDKGVARYDGSSWTNFDSTDGLFNNYRKSYALITDVNGVVRAGVGSSSYAFDGTKWNEESLGLENGGINCFLIDNSDSLWCGGQKGLFKYRNKRWYPFAGSEIKLEKKIAIDTLGIIWGLYLKRYSRSAGLARFNWDTWSTCDTLNEIVGNYTSVISEDQTGNIWIGTNIGISVFDGSQWITYDTSSVNQGLENNFIQDIKFDQAGNGWVATNGGVNRFDGQNWVHFNSSNGLICDTVTSIVIDNLGNKWFGTKRGLSKYDGINWTSFDTTNGLVSNDISSLTVDQNNNLWVGFQKRGVGKFNDTLWTFFDTSDGLGSNVILSVEADKNNAVWICGHKTVHKFDKGSWSKIYNEGGYINFYDVVLDSTGTHWFATNSGIFQYNKGKWYNNYKIVDGLCSNVQTSNYVDSKGDIWFATSRGASKLIRSTVDIKGKRKLYSKKSKSLLNISSKISSSLLKISFFLPLKQNITLNMYNSKGVLIDRVYNGESHPGENIVEFNTRKMPSGVYFCRLSTQKSGSLCTKVAVFK